MAAPKLTKEQKAQILQMLAEGETQAAIAEKVGCAQPNIAYYAELHKTELDAAWEAYKQQAISRGYGSREYRIDKLGKLASRINERLEESLEAEEVKISSTGQTVRYNIFNAPEVAAYRAILDDIAKELGGRAAKQIVSGPNDGPVSVEIDDVTNLTPKERANRLLTLLESARTRRDVPLAES